MILLLLFAFISGLVTILAPCIWPLLPIVLASSKGGKAKSLGITIGISASFAVLTLMISYLVSLLGFDPDSLRLFAVVILTILGLSLIVPKFSAGLEAALSKISSSGGKWRIEGNSFLSGLVTGASLGIVWSPCAGPILASIAALATTRNVNFGIILVTLVYVTGLSIPLFFFSYGSGIFISKSRFLSKYTGRIQQVFGGVIILTAIVVYTNYDKVLQVKLLESFPSYTKFIYDLEGNRSVSEELDRLTGNSKAVDMKGKVFRPVDMPSDGSNEPFLPNYGPAADFTGIIKWLNTDRALTMEDLRGKVVLIDFWTYTCINCIRTLPHVTSWHEKYRDKNLLVVGVHTPEFEFEKKTENVQMAIKQYGIEYPVAQDNNYSTWRAYNNRYWPAKYLIDKDGNLRYFHFGEGKYEETEKAIRQLIKETGADPNEIETALTDATPRGSQTPETYLGNQRAERFRADKQLTYGSRVYKREENLPLHNFTYEGKWEVAQEYSKAGAGSSLWLKFYASKVFLVIHPETGKANRIKVYLDGKSQKEEIQISEPKLYEIINLPAKGEHLLKLEFLDEGASLFAFTFG